MNQCLWCGYGPIKDSYDLCYDCYDSFQIGEIDKCSCGAYKDSEYDLCYDCYQTKQSTFKSRTKTKFNDKMIKGRLAETIVQELFLALGYEVYPFGMERTIPGFSTRQSPKTGGVANKIRKMPDFVVVKDDKSFFLEVKFRSDANPAFSFENYPYPEAYFVLVTPDYIKMQMVSKLKKGEPFEYLNKFKEFETDTEIIKAYVDFTRKFLRV